VFREAGKGAMTDVGSAACSREALLEAEVAERTRSLSESTTGATAVESGPQ